MQTRKRLGHRLGVVISGNQDWVKSTLEQLYCQLSVKSTLWLADTLSCLPAYAKESARLVKRGQVVSLLGSESDLLVIDGFSGLNPDAVAGLTGTIKHGGGVIFLAPELEQWGSYNDPEYQKIVVPPYNSTDIPGLFLKHFGKVLIQFCHTGDFIRLCEGDELDKAVDEIVRGFYDAGVSKAKVSEPLDEPLKAPLKETEVEHADLQTAAPRTADQQGVVEEVKRVCTGHRRRPLVLTADRGRGKSAAIGMALADLLRGPSEAVLKDSKRQAGNSSVAHPIQKNPYQFLVTAPALASVERLFFHCAEALGVEISTPGILHWHGSTVRYCSPESVMEEKITTTMLIVDEAAAIGTPLLNLWLVAFSRIVFSSTIHGYEGSGQGFAIRFQQSLNKETPQHRRATLSKPIRWCEGDALETFLNTAFLLDAEADSVDSAMNAGNAGNAINISRIDRSELLSQTSLLSSIYGLLIMAHYKTTPGDLRNLLDGPNLEVFVAKSGQRVVGALMLAKEGDFENDLATAIWQGRRRPRGHVIPQTLSVQCGYKRGLTLKSARIIRVAVHPSLQQRGIGKRLVEEAKVFGQQQGFDWLGSSFGATEPLIRFWASSGLKPVRIGISLDGSSGSYSALVLAPLQAELADDFHGLQKNFYHHFKMALRNYYQKMSLPLLLLLLRSGGKEYPYFGGDSIKKSWQDVEGFLYYQRPYDAVFPSLCCWFFQRLLVLEWENDSDKLALFVDLFVRQKAIEEVAKQWGKGGVKSLLKMIRNTILNLNDNVSDLQ